MRKTLLVTVLALAVLTACTSATAPTAPAAHDCINGTWTGSGQAC